MDIELIKNKYLRISTFKKHNLFKPYGGSEKFDLVLLRNVLIYFTKEDQEKVLKNIFNCMSSDGYLIIGESESLSQVHCDFESVSPLIYRIKNSSKNKKVA